MTPLLQALTDAAKVGFDVPKCGRCWRCRSCGGRGHLSCGCHCECDQCDGSGRAHKRVVIHVDEFGDEGTELVMMTTKNDGPDPQCRKCAGTGLDATDPERLIGRAMAWLRAHSLNVEVRTCQCGDGIDRHVANSWFREPGKLPALEEHDDTPAGLATALLCLVARVGVAPPAAEQPSPEKETP